MGKEGEVIDRPLLEQETWRDSAQPIIKRIAFVSGGMGGIGSAICRRLALAGHTIVAGCLPGYQKKDEWLGAMRKEGFAVRLEPVRAPDTLDVGQAHARDFRHRAVGPMGRFARRFGERQSHGPLGHLTRRLRDKSHLNSWHRIPV